MCQYCGCSTNKEHAKREEFQVFNGVFAVNLMSSLGSGKTSLVEKTIELLQDIRIGVINGDLETDRDAQRIRAKGAPAVQITTGSAYHLDAFIADEGIHLLPMEGLGLVYLERAGNLVCPASYDVGVRILPLKRRRNHWANPDNRRRWNNARERSRS